MESLCNRTAAVKRSAPPAVAEVDDQAAAKEARRRHTAFAFAEGFAAGVGQVAELYDHAVGKAGIREAMTKLSARAEVYMDFALSPSEFVRQVIGGTDW